MKDGAQVKAGKLELHCEPVDLADLIKECARLMRESAAEQGLRITITTTPLPLLFADRLRVKQILLNLLSNAIKFTPKGGRISISAECDPKGYVVIGVRDTGIGIAPEMIPIVFEPFRQVDSDLARRFDGTGLGLSLVKSLMELHDGEVAIESTPGEGTVVSVIFPATCCVEEPAARPARSQ